MNTPVTPAIAAPAPISVLLVKKENHNKLSSFVNDEKGGLLPSIYLRRSAMPGLETAKEIRVTIEISA
jgi:hypothetical protein